jgi:hypothetical protein
MSCCARDAPHRGGLHERTAAREDDPDHRRRPGHRAIALAFAREGAAVIATDVTTLASDESRFMTGRAVVIDGGIAL